LYPIERCSNPVWR